MNQPIDLGGLSNDALLSRIQESAREAKRRLVSEIVMLIEVERRRLHLEMAYSSMYEFCRREMKLSEDQSYRYVNAMKLVKKFPEILEDLESGQLHLASLSLLKKHVRVEADGWLLDEARGKSKREVERTLARHFPKDDEPRERVVPLSETRAHLEVTVTLEMVDKIAYAKELMSHSNPNQSAEVVLEAGLDALIEKLEKSRQAKAERPRPTIESEEISRGVRREVFERDGWQCSFESKTGNRCESKAFLELDHEQPRALNGKSDVDNVRVLCQAHNQYEARRVLGDACVDRAQAQAQAQAQMKSDPARADTDRMDVLVDALVRMGFKRPIVKRAMDEERSANSKCEEESDATILRNLIQRLR